MTDYVDGYCERVAPGLWGEPFNDLGNLAFLVAAVLVWRLANGDRTGRVLAGLIGLVFVASTVFHLLATRWAAVADSVAILGFMVVYAVVFAHGRWKWVAAPAFLALTAGAALLGGGLYFGTLISLGVFAAVAAAKRDGSWTHFAVAGAVFALSLSLRALDRDVCDYVPVGTHFLWHLLTGLVLYLVSRALLRP
ncbi:hypothetical protein [Amycolatopsis tolypomycina]|uniref:hypothetical protein n=1 Tax=Amycolatopsis tolypomycina TaxID=208445 RepID=UPI0033AA6EB6